MSPVPWRRVGLLLLAMAAMVAGIAGGLARLGGVPSAGSATAFHGALMVSGFLGTVISLERAVALGMPLALLVPLAAGAGTVALLAGLVPVGAALWIAAAVGLLAASLAIVRRQRETHTVLLAVAAAAWVGGNALFALGLHAPALPWWFAFLVLTIAAERLEMTRLTRRPPGSVWAFHAVIAAMLAGAALAIGEGRAGALVFGLALAALALWLAVFDIARRTVKTQGFARYAAVALLAGYVWLALGGLAWAFAPAMRDFVMHALGLGFVFSMILAHAPLIVPSIVRRPMRFTPLFYAPLALLHASLLLRFAFGAELRLAGALLNAAALALFVALVLWRINGVRPAMESDPIWN